MHSFFLSFMLFMVDSGFVKDPNSTHRPYPSGSFYTMKDMKNAKGQSTKLFRPSISLSTLKLMRNPCLTRASLMYVNS